jgi:cytochrome b561
MDQPHATASMPLRGRDPMHPDGQYSRPAKWFHWLTVPLLGFAILSGMVIESVEEKHKLSFYQLHESTGLIILMLASARLAWRLYSPPPAHPDHLPRMIRIAAETVHRLLYAILIVQPLLGFFATNAFGFPLRGDTAFLGFIDLPKFMETNEALANPLITIHRTIGWTLPFLLATHICGAIYHHVRRKDGTLLRML